MNIELQTQLLKLKGILNGVSHASFSYAKLEKLYPMHSLDNEKARQLITAYTDLVDTLINSITKNEDKDSTHQNLEG